MNKWKIHKSIEVFKNHFLTLIESTVENPRNKLTAPFLKFHMADWVNIIAFDNNKNLVLVNQWRFSCEDFSLELPGGVIEPGESAIEAGVRELKQETGYVPGPETEVKLLGSFMVNPGLMTNSINYVLVESAELVSDLDLDPMEDISVELVDQSSLVKKIETGEIHNSLSVLGIKLLN